MHKHTRELISNVTEWVQQPHPSLLQLHQTPGQAVSLFKQDFSFLPLPVLKPLLVPLQFLFTLQRFNNCCHCLLAEPSVTSSLPHISQSVLIQISICLLSSFTTAPLYLHRRQHCSAARVKGLGDPAAVKKLQGQTESPAWQGQVEDAELKYEAQWLDVAVFPYLERGQWYWLPWAMPYDHQMKGVM